MISNNAFIEEIEKIKVQTNASYMESVLLWCQKNNQEIETAAYWVKRDTIMKAKIMSEAESLNTLKKR